MAHIKSTRMLGLVLLLSLAARETQAGVIPYHLWDVYYDYTRPTNTKQTFTVDVNLTVTKDPGVKTYYYWSHFMWFTDKTQAPKASSKVGPDSASAYAGLQTNGDHKSFIFSVWNGVSGRSDQSAAGKKTNPITGKSNSYCEPFGGEGDGYHCFYTTDWSQGVPYRIRISLLSRTSSGDTFRCVVTDTKAKADYLVGDITVPAFYGVPSSSVLFYEYYLPVDKCSAIPPAATVFDGLSLKIGSKSYKPKLSLVLLDKGYPCPGYADLTVCNTKLTSSSPARTPLTKAPSNTCKAARYGRVDGSSDGSSSGQAAAAGVGVRQVPLLPRGGQ